MPPPDKTPESQLRYFLRLLAAIVSEGGNELRIPLSALRKLDADGNRQALLEDTDLTSDELVLRFGTKNSAMYPVEPECQTRPQSPPSPQPQAPSPALSRREQSQPPLHPGVRKPLSVQDLARAELKLRKLRLAAQLKSEAAAKNAAVSRNRQTDSELDILLNASDDSLLS